MAVRWKFRSESDLKSYRLDGRRSVSIGELKSSILLSRKGLEAMEIDIYNPITEEKYYDDDMVSRGENVEVRVRPLEEGARPPTTSMATSSSSSSSSLTFVRPVVPTFSVQQSSGSSESSATSSNNKTASILAERAKAAQKKREESYKNGGGAPTRPKKWVSKRPRQQTKQQQQQYQNHQQQQQQERKPKTREVLGIPKRLLVTQAAEEEVELNADGTLAVQSVTLDGQTVVGIKQMDDKFKQNFQRHGGHGPADNEFEDDGQHLLEVAFEGSEVTARGDAMLVIGSARPDLPKVAENDIQIPAALPKALSPVAAPVAAPVVALVVALAGTTTGI